MIEFHPIRNWKIRKELKKNEKEKARAKQIVENVWFQKEIYELKCDLFGDANSQVEAGRAYIAEATNSLLDNGKEINSKYDNLTTEMKKLRKECGQNSLQLERVKSLEKAFESLKQEYIALKGKVALYDEYFKNTDGQIESLTAGLKALNEKEDSDFKNLKNNVGILSRKKEADNEISIGKIKLKDLHTAEDVLRAVLAMDKKTSAIEKKVDAVYNVNRGAGRLSVVKRVKPNRA